MVTLVFLSSTVKPSPKWGVCLAMRDVQVHSHVQSERGC